MKKSEKSVEKMLRDRNYSRKLAIISNLDDRVMTIFEKILSLAAYEKSELEKYLDGLIERARLNPLSLSTENLLCPHCESDKYVKNGVTCGRQRYKCSNCTKTFSIATNTSVHQLHLVEKWSKFVKLMLNSSRPLSLKETMKEIEISMQTAFDWRHKLLAALNKLDPMKIHSRTEIDEVSFQFTVKGPKKEKYPKKVMSKDQINELVRLETHLKNSLNKKKTKSRKNAKFLFLHNRHGDFDFQPLTIHVTGSISAELIKNAFEAFPIENDDEKLIIYSDRATGIRSYMEERDDIQHEHFNATTDDGKTDSINANHINGTVSDLRSWLKPFNGFSTKYIWNYLNWFKFQRKFINLEKYDSNNEYSDDLKLEYMVTKSVSDQEGYNRHREIPLHYLDYLKRA